MQTVSTTRIVAERALGRLDGPACVDWAVGMLVAGHDGDHLAMLAGMSPPFNAFEMADLRDRALEEVGAPALAETDALMALAAELFRPTLADDSMLIEVLRTAKDLCIAYDYPDALYDFYMLFFAYDDLLHDGVQWYWDGATRDTIMGFVRKRAAALIASVSA